MEEQLPPTILKARRKRGYGIWANNRKNKPKRKFFAPKIKLCLDCKTNRVRHHHLLCDTCWFDRQKERIR